MSPGKMSTTFDSESLHLPDHQGCRNCSPLSLESGSPSNWNGDWRRDRTRVRGPWYPESGTPMPRGPPVLLPTDDGGGAEGHTDEAVGTEEVPAPPMPGAWRGHTPCPLKFPTGRGEVAVGTEPVWLHSPLTHL